MEERLRADTATVRAELVKSEERLRAEMVKMEERLRADTAERDERLQQSLLLVRSDVTAVSDRIARVEHSQASLEGNVKTLAEVFTARLAA